jgi:formylglycine-generating enzyme required for sulfatase activity
MTQAQWQRIVGQNPSAYHTDFLEPVENVSWESSAFWLKRLALLLPTEAQWEYAVRDAYEASNARAETTAAETRTGEFPSQVRATTHYASPADHVRDHVAIGSFPPSPSGLHDLLGNVWEWCRFFDGTEPELVVQGLPLHIYRGGFRSEDDPLPTRTYRASFALDFRSSWIGIRPTRLLDRGYPKPESR